MKNHLYLFLSLLLLIGCSHIAEPFKVIWGSSTRALEEARVDGISQSFTCTFDECFDAVLKLGRSVPLADLGYPESAASAQSMPSFSLEEDTRLIDDGVFDVFIKDRIKGHIIVMGVRGNVNSTEVGIFFTRPEKGTIKIDISSLSDTAKRKVAGAVFKALDQQFKRIN